MATTKNLRLARFLKVGLDILFGAMVFAGVALVLWMALSPLIIQLAGIPGTVTVPVTVGSGDVPEMQVTFANPPDDTISAAIVEQAAGTLLLETRNVPMIVISNAPKLVAAIGLGYVFYLLRGVVQAILGGTPFEAENARRIRMLGFAVLGVGILVQAVTYLAAAEILNRLPTTIPALNPGSTFDPGSIFAALFVLLLAQIWSYGLELERDQALTI